MSETNDITNLVTTLNDLTWTGAIVLVALIVCYAAYTIFMQWREKKSKDARSLIYSSALEKLATSINTHDYHSVQALNQSSDQLKRNQVTLKGLERVVTKLEAKSKGKMTRVNSQEIVEITFNQIIAEFKDCFRQSLRENDYENRRTHVETRVKGILSKVLADQQAMLSRLDSLSIDFSKFFQMRQREQEQYTLVHLIWKETKKCYTLDMGVDARIDESVVIIEHHVWNHFAQIKRMLDEADKPSESYNRSDRQGQSSSRMTALEKHKDGPAVA